MGPGVLICRNILLRTTTIDSSSDLAWISVEVACSLIGMSARSSLCNGTHRARSVSCLCTRDTGWADAAWPWVVACDG